MMKKLMIIAALLSIMTIAFAGCGKKDNPSGNDVSSNMQQEKVQPTFMYFVAKSDANYDEAMKVAQELEAEYGDRVKFMVQDVDEHPELKENYMINQEDSPMPRHTPTLIMLDTNNDISSMNLSECTDKEALKTEIEKALNK